MANAEPWQATQRWSLGGASRLDQDDLGRKEFNLIKAERSINLRNARCECRQRSNTRPRASGPPWKRYEAMQELDGFIDQALLNNMAQVDIQNHGIGTGVIREGDKIPPQQACQEF